MQHKYTVFIGLCLIFSISVQSQTDLSLSIKNCNTLKVEILIPSIPTINKVEKSYLLEVEILKDVWAKIGIIKTKSNTALFKNQKTNGRYRASLVGHFSKKSKEADFKNLKSKVQYSNSVYFNKDMACNPTFNSANIEQNKSLGFNVYPNPVKSILVIETNDVEIGAMAEIRDIHGRQIMKINIQNGSNTISVNQLTDGVYFLKMLHSANYSEVKKIFVKASKF